jgi:hypothetical protein
MPSTKQIMADRARSKEVMAKVHEANKAASDAHLERLRNRPSNPLGLKKRGRQPRRG